MKLKVIVNRNRLLFKVIGPRSGINITSLLVSMMCLTKCIYINLHLCVTMKIWICQTMLVTGVICLTSPHWNAGTYPTRHHSCVSTPLHHEFDVTCRTSRDVHVLILQNLDYHLSHHFLTIYVVKLDSPETENQMGFQSESQRRGYPQNFWVSWWHMTC